MQFLKLASYETVSFPHAASCQSRIGLAMLSLLPLVAVVKPHLHVIHIWVHRVLYMYFGSFEVDCSVLPFPRNKGGFAKVRHVWPIKKKWIQEPHSIDLVVGGRSVCFRALSHNFIKDGGGGQCFFLLLFTFPNLVPIFTAGNEPSSLR